MKQDDWTQQLKDRLNDYEEPVPADLWADIEAQLPASQKATVLPPAPQKATELPASQKTTVVPWHRWAAAAAVLLLVGGGLLILWNRQEEGQAVQNQMTAQNKQLAAELPSTVPVPAPQHQEHQAVALIDEHQPAPLIDEHQPEPLPEEHQPELLKDEHQDVVPRNDDQPTAPRNDGQPTAPRNDRPTAPSGTFPLRPARTQQSLTATHYAMNTFQDQQHSTPVMMSNEMAGRFITQSDSYGARQEAPIWLTDYEEREHHDQPITLGMKVGYPLTDRLSVSTGVVYTKLQADFTTIMKGRQIGRHQVLQYVGIPLSMDYRLLQWRRFSLYAAAGVQADWNVKARQTISHTEADAPRDACQWSLNGSLGLAVELLPHVSLYVEPALSHHFDNHSRVSTYFKERPTAVSLQLGVRLNLGQSNRDIHVKE